MSFAALVAVVVLLASHRPPAACPWTSPPGPLPGGPSRVGVLAIGALGLRTPVFEGTWPDMSTEASRSLMHGPAFYPQTMPWDNSLPGQRGTVGMAGHRTTRTHPFCLIAGLRRGDYATITMGYGTFTYRMVREVRVPAGDWIPFERPQSLDPARTKGREYLVLGACDPPHFATWRRDAVFRLVAERGA